MASRQTSSQKSLFEIASQQGGYFTSTQAKKAGLYTRLQNYHHQRGNWIREGRGIYRLRDFPLHQHADWIQLCLWTRNKEDITQGVISHESAAYFYELADYLPVRTSLTVPPDFRRRVPAPCFFYKADIPPNELEQQDGFCITTPYRTLLDLLDNHSDPSLWPSALAQAHQRGLIKSDQKTALWRKWKRKVG